MPVILSSLLILTTQSSVNKAGQRSPTKSPQKPATAGKRQDVASNSNEMNDLMNHGRSHSLLIIFKMEMRNQVQYYLC